MNLEGSAGDYITGGKAYAFSETTGEFSVVLSQDRKTLVVKYSDAIAPGETFSRNWFNVEFQAIQGYTLQPGKYSSATRYPFNSNNVEYGDGTVPSKITNTNGFALGGNGRGCNQLTADFDLIKMEVSNNGQILNFEAQFVQYCGNGAEYTKGLISLKRGERAEIKVRLH